MQYTNFHYDSDKEESNQSNQQFNNKRSNRRKDNNSLEQKTPEKLYSNYKQEQVKAAIKETTTGDISQNAKDLIMKYEHQIHVDQLNQWGQVARQKDKSSRATIQHTLDPRTLVILCKLIKNGILKEIRGCVATGKEANVLEGVDSKGGLLAIKVYRTSILGFKDRERYVNGEWRFRSGVCYSNPRKMIKIWAEKEFRNLKRMNESGVCCSPEPVLVKGNIVVMKWVGGNDGPAKRLKDIQFEQEQWSKVYLEVLIDMWGLWNECKLVHADLSEFNMLWWEEKVWVIDVAQSVEHDHPQAIQFLRMDCLNVNNFFKKKGVITFSVKQVFDLITDLNLNQNNLAEQLQGLIDKAEPDNQQEDENLFMQAHIPRTLGEIPLKQVEQDIDKLQNQDISKDNQAGEALLYAKLAGIQMSKEQQEKKIKKSQKDESNNNNNNPDKREKRELKRNKEQQKFQTYNSNQEGDHEGETFLLDNLVEQSKRKQNQEEESSEDQNSVDSEDEDEELQEEGKNEKKKSGWTKYEGMSKSERKKLVKEEKREKRKNKIPKKVKKQLVKKTK